MKSTIGTLLAGLVLPIAIGCAPGSDAETGSGTSAAAGSGSGEAATPAGGSGETPRNVRVLELQKSELSEYLVVSGPLHPVRGTDLSTEENGVVDRVVKPKGSTVSAGQAIIELDRRILKAQMESAKAGMTLRKFNEERTKQLYDENSVSGQEMLLVHTQSEQATAEADIARIRYERAAITAPFDGIVADRYVEVGELVTAGTPVVRIIDPFTLKLVGGVSEREVARVPENADVAVRFEGSGGTVEGRVVFVGFEADPLTGKFPIEVEIGNRDRRLRAGMLGRAQIETRNHGDVLAIPRDAVVDTPTGPCVFVAMEGHAERRSIGLGPDQGLMVVVQHGLEAGEKLIVRGHRDVRNGTPIQIREEASRSDGSIERDPDEVRRRDRTEDTQGNEIGGGLK